METNKKYLKDLESSERIKAIKERFGDLDSFLMKVSPEAQVLMSDFRKAVLDDYPTLDDVSLTYGKNAVKTWLCSQIVSLAIFGDAKNLTKGQIEELASIIAIKYKDLKVSEVLHFFYCFKSGRFNPSETISPMSIIISLRDFIIMRDTTLLLGSQERERAAKVYLIVEDLPKTKVYGRVFKTKERAEKALEERDVKTHERLYPSCHIVERTIE